MLRRLSFYTKRAAKRSREILCLPRHPFVWTPFKALVLTAPPAIIGYISVDFKGAPPLGQARLVAYLARNEPLFVAILLAPLLLMILLDVWEKWTAQDTTKQKPGSDEFVAVLKGIDDVVAVKSRGIAEYALRVRQTRAKRSEAFARVVQPEQQINEIAGQLYYAMRKITADDEIKLVLVPIVDGVPDSYAVYMPKDATPPNNMLKESPRRTMFFFAARDNEVKVIADIEAYLQLTPIGQREYRASEREDDKGSILCIPVKHPHWEKVVYVLSFKSAIPGTFTTSNKRKYQRISEYFSKRILMEHSLRIILDNTDAS